MSGAGTPRRSGRALWLLTILAALLAFWLFPSRRAYHKARRVLDAYENEKPSASAVAGVADPGSPSASNAQQQATPPEPPSHLADDLNAPGKDIHSDLRIVNDLFEQYRASTHGLDPIGSNREITAALAGNNRLGYQFLPKNHPAINSRGELMDRWGTPFFFHQLGGDEMQIRSAGPDRKLYTDDDEVLTPGANPPHL